MPLDTEDRLVQMNVSMELTALGAWKIVVVIVLKTKHVILLAAHAKTVVAKDGLVQIASLLAVTVHMVKTVSTIAADTASKMKLVTGLRDIVLMAVTLVGTGKRVTENVLPGLLVSTVTVPVEMVARIGCVTQ